ncbi:MAG: NAD(P)H-dependent glycerol-3-phosphate dehydrogenase [Thermoanaerobaculia bacterium]|nr:NAD(P)H-dependent glycerol-3-phosphate dehydrogenase [Thermoanaerobaculia bacterium]
MSEMKIAVVGAGSWGSALALAVSRAEHEVLLWAHDPEVARQIAETRSNPVYLPTARFNDLVSFTNDLAEVARFSDMVMMVTPSHYYREVLGQLRAHLTEPIRVISGTKGIENETLSRISEVSASVLGEGLTDFAVLSGPTFAAEVSLEHPTTAVIASENEAFASLVQHELSYEAFRLYRSDDVVGVELGGSLKNVIAIASGVIDGLGYGLNTTAALVTRGLHEVRRLGVNLGGRPETFAGLAGMGDLLLTCTGNLSRNRSVGVQLGQGKTLQQILHEARYVAEGVKTSKSAKELADRHDTEMPIVDAMYEMLYEGASPQDCLNRLMTRSLKAETEG